MNRCSPPLTRRAGRGMLGLFMLLMILGPLGCASAKPKEHWWQFWRSKPAVEAGTFNPDTVVLPPPPETVRGAPGTGTLPPPPVTGANALTNEGAAPLRTPPGPAVSELRTVYFDFDSAELSPEATATLDQNAQWLLAHPAIQILIEGHCDERGSVEYNFSLGERRANMVRTYLTQKGVAPDTLHTISYGKDRPVDPARSEDAFRKNRRAQFFVY